MIDRETVIWAYRLILGREPESEGAIAYHRAHESLQQLRKTLLGSDEFQQLQPSAHQSAETISFPERADFEREKLVFLHCPKTGGTTLHELLIQEFQPTRVCPERFNGLKNMPAGQLLHYHFFSGHFDLVSCQLIPGAKRIITFLREPMARLLSLYNFLRAHRPDVVARQEWELARLATQLDAEAFFCHADVRGHPYINNGMTRALVDRLPIEAWPTVDPSVRLADVSNKSELALERLKEMPAFGLLEQYEQSVAMICKALGIAPPGIIERKMVLNDLISKPGHYRPIKQAYASAELAQVLEELITTDRALYCGARALFEARLRSIGV